MCGGGAPSIPKPTPPPPPPPQLINPEAPTDANKALPSKKGKNALTIDLATSGASGGTGLAIPG